MPKIFTLCPLIEKEIVDPCSRKSLMLTVTNCSHHVLCLTDFFMPLSLCTYCSFCLEDHSPLSCLENSFKHSRSCLVFISFMKLLNSPNVFYFLFWAPMSLAQMCVKELIFAICIIIPGFMLISYQSMSCRGWGSISLFNFVSSVHPPVLGTKHLP